MTIKELQEKIDTAGKDPQRNLEVAQSYLEGTVLRDPVAAEAWLQRVLELDEGESLEAVEAMRLLGTEVWKKETVLTDADYEQIFQELQTMQQAAQFPDIQLQNTQGNRKEYLEKLEKLGTQEQRETAGKKQRKGAGKTQQQYDKKTLQ